MRWVRLDDSFFDNAKIIRAGRDARDLYLVALTFSGHNLTDGFIAAETVGLLAVKALVTSVEDAIARLVDNGLWEVCNGGWQIHDYREYNPSAESVKGQREKARLRMQAARELYKGRSQEVRANFARSSHNHVDLRTPSPVSGPSSEPVPEKERKLSKSADFDAARAAPPPKPLVDEKPKPVPTRQQEYFQALTEAFGDPVTASERSERGKHARELAAAEVNGLVVTPDEIPRLRDEQRDRWPNVELTERSVVRNVKTLLAPRPVARNGHDPPNGTRPVDLSTAHTEPDAITKWKQRQEAKKRDSTSDPPGDPAAARSRATAH